MIPLVYPSDRSYGVGTKYKIYITVSKFIVKNRINVKNNDSNVRIVAGASGRLSSLREEVERMRERERERERRMRE